jgi:hypothetical protein
MPDHYTRVLELLLPLSGRLVHFELHTDMHVDAPASLIAVGLLATAETNMPGVPEGERVLIKIGDDGPRVVITVADITSIETDRLHGPDCPCFGVVTSHASFVFMDAGAHMTS